MARVKNERLHLWRNAKRLHRAFKNDIDEFPNIVDRLAILSQIDDSGEILPYMVDLLEDSHCVKVYPGRGGVYDYLLPSQVDWFIHYFRSELQRYAQWYDENATAVPVGRQQRPTKKTRYG